MSIPAISHARSRRSGKNPAAMATKKTEVTISPLDIRNIRRAVVFCWASSKPGISRIFFMFPAFAVSSIALAFRLIQEELSGDGEQKDGICARLSLI